MPEQPVVEVTPEWNQDSVEKQARELESQSAASQPDPKPGAEQTETEQSEQPEQHQRPKDTPEVEMGKTKAALAEERVRRRAEAAKARNLEQSLVAMQQEMAALRQAQQPQYQAPDPAQDPAGAILHTQRQTQQQIFALQQQQYQREQEELQRQQVQTFVTTVKSLNDEFAKDQPDANDGINFLKSARVEEYKAMGMTHAEANARMQNEEIQLVQWAFQNGENPAKVAFEMAKARGYVSPKQKLDMQRQGQGASMPSGAGGRSGGKISLEALAKLSGDEFAKATSGANWEKLMKNA
jgi:hypothetical protein